MVNSTIRRWRQLAENASKLFDQFLYIEYSKYKFRTRDEKQFPLDLCKRFIRDYTGTLSAGNTISMLFVPVVFRY